MRTDAIKLSQKEQALLRRQAIRMKERGDPTAEIAAVLAVHPKTVARWWTAYRRHGAATLRPGQRGRRVGAQRVLTPAQEQVVCRLLREKTPDQLTLPFALWTRQAVSDLLVQRYGVRLPIRTMGAYLGRWGFTPQKPRTRAYEQSPAAVQRWLATTYPAIARQAKADGAEIFWGDQTGLNNQPNVTRGYAPRGQTPVVRQQAARFSLSMMSAVTNRGSIRFMCYPGALNATRCCTFLRRLVKTASGRKLVLILDNLRVHHSKPVKTWLAGHAAEITVHYLPSYSPELNPDEHLNRDLKGTLARQPAPRDARRLAQQTLRHLRSIQKQPARIRQYFATRHTAYAA